MGGKAYGYGGKGVRIWGKAYGYGDIDFKYFIPKAYGYGEKVYGYGDIDFKAVFAHCYRIRFAHPA
jgi:hypothetical protein